MAPSCASSCSCCWRSPQISSHLPPPQSSHGNSPKTWSHDATPVPISRRQPSPSAFHLHAISTNVGFREPLRQLRVLVRGGRQRTGALPELSREFLRQSTPVSPGGWLTRSTTLERRVSQYGTDAWSPPALPVPCHRCDRDPALPSPPLPAYTSTGLGLPQSRPDQTTRGAARFKLTHRVLVRGRPRWQAPIGGAAPASSVLACSDQRPVFRVRSAPRHLHFLPFEF